MSEMKRVFSIIGMIVFASTAIIIIKVLNLAINIVGPPLAVAIIMAGIYMAIKMTSDITGLFHRVLNWAGIGSPPKKRRKRTKK